MNIPLSASLVTVLDAAPFAYADSSYERELKQLVEQRDKALSAATTPIIARFNSAAEQLLRRATQAGDLDAANKVKEAMSADPVGALIPPAAGQIKDLRRQLAGTKWITVPAAQLRGGLTSTLTFGEKTVEPGPYQYEANHDTVIITFNRGGKQPLELTKDGKHPQIIQGSGGVRTFHALGGTRNPPQAAVRRRTMPRQSSGGPSPACRVSASSQNAPADDIHPSLHPAVR